MAERFVILEHSGHGAVHWDFMLESGAALATWQVGCDPCGLAVGEEAAARRLADHRLAYLTYEGAVSGGRGSVRRVASGQYELVERQLDRWQVTLQSGRGGEVAEFAITLTSPGGTDWTLVRLS
ncbi:MAG: DNA polymerase ligase N-terminal domain-containing protein [Planctomycetaceae bacterium]